MLLLSAARGGGALVLLVFLAGSLSASSHGAFVVTSKTPGLAAVGTVLGDGQRRTGSCVHKRPLALRMNGGSSARESRTLSKNESAKPRSGSWSEAKIVTSSAAGEPLPPGTGENVLVIGVAGGSGGGKSVFCKKLEGLIRRICPTVVLSHDSYYKDKVDVDRDCNGNWDCPEALHTEELVRDVEKLKKGERVVVPEYDFAANARAANGGSEFGFEAGVKGVLLVEGLMVLHDDMLRREMDMRIYVDCDEDTRFMRRLARDTHPTSGRGRTVAQVYDAWAKNVKPNHHRFVEPTKRWAHIILPHHGVFADPGHLLAVGNEGVQTSAVETDEESKADEVEGESEAHMFPVLYMIEAYVSAFTGRCG